MKEKLFSYEIKAYDYELDFEVDVNLKSICMRGLQE